MLYEITRHYSDCASPGACGECDLSYETAATIEEARRRAWSDIARPIAELSYQTWCTFYTVNLACRDIPETGGTIDLHDGTSITITITITITRGNI